MELHLISNGKQPLKEFAELAAIVNPYVTAIHLREKARSAKELWEGISHLSAMGITMGKVYVNDRIDLALATGAKGVQLPYHGLEPDVVKRMFPMLRVGRSIHSIEEAKVAEEQGADFLLFGHVFTSLSKPNLEARGMQALKKVVEAVQLPVIAIGGIQPHHVWEIKATGAAGIAVMSGIIEAKSPEMAAREYINALMGE